MYENYMSLLTPQDANWMQQMYQQQQMNPQGAMMGASQYGQMPGAAMTQMPMAMQKPQAMTQPEAMAQPQAMANPMAQTPQGKMNAYQMMGKGLMGAGQGMKQPMPSGNTSQIIRDNNQFRYANQQPNQQQQMANALRRR